MSARRVLHCIPSMEGGGAERQLTYLAGALGRQGWTVHVAVTRRGSNWPRLEASGAVIHEVAVRSAHDWRAVGAIRRIVTEVQPDVLQAWLLQMEVIGGLAALVTHTPWVFSERSSARAYPPGLKNYLRQAVAQLATAVVSNSAGGDDYWAARLRKGVRRYVIPNALPLEEIDATPAATADQMGLVSGLPIVLFAGRFGPEKNLQTLLPALDRVRTRQALQILCCGEGSLRPEVEAWAASARASGTRVVVTGYAHDLWALMKGASMLVSPSLFEGSPNVVLEAMACGVPLVVSDIPQHRELLDESSALLAPPHAVEALAAAIEGVLRAPADAAARARVARERCSRYSLSMVSRQYIDVYEQILSTGASR